MINAQSHFSKKRYEHEFHWQPSLEIREAIEEAILGLHDKASEELNMVNRMNLFITKGAGLRVLRVRSRKEQSDEEISFGVGAYETHSQIASSPGA